MYLDAKRIGSNDTHKCPFVKRRKGKMACENMPLRFYQFSGLSPLPFMTPYVALGLF
jgi:hypothetical protein